MEPFGPFRSIETFASPLHCAPSSQVALIAQTPNTRVHYVYIYHMMPLLYTTYCVQSALESRSNGGPRRELELAKAAPRNYLVAS